MILITSTSWVRPNYNGTLTSWTVDANTSGSVVMTIAKNGVDMIGAGNAPKLISNNNQSAAISGWTTTTFSAGDLITFGITGPSTITKVLFTINLTKS